MFIDHYGIHLGSFYLRFYGIIIMFGVLAASLLTQRELRRRGEDPELVWDCLTWLLIGGIIGARLWHIFTPTPALVAQGITAWYYLTHPLDAIAIWRGGLGIGGAVLGGALALWLFTRRKNLSYSLWVDSIAPGLALAQAIGRWGNFINQELYGAPSNLPWAIPIDPQNRLPGYEQFERFHPLFLYESIWNFANMLFLLWLGRKYAHKLKSGDIFLVYLMTYPFGRFMLDFLRLDAARLETLNINQTVMAITFVCAGVALWLRHRQSQPTEAS